MTTKPAHAESDEQGRLSVSKEQRDLLFERIIRNLARVDDLLLAVRNEDLETAGRLGRDLYSEVTLVTKDLGWGAPSGDGSFEVSTSPNIVRAVLTRLRDEAEDLDLYIDVRDDSVRNQELIRTCEELLGALQRGRRGSAPKDRTRALPSKDRLAQREIVVAALEALPARLTTRQIIEVILPHGDHNQVDLERALSEILGLGILNQTPAGVLVPSDLLLGINELWDGMCEVI